MMELGFPATSSPSIWQLKSATWASFVRKLILALSFVQSLVKDRGTKIRLWAETGLPIGLACLAAVVGMKVGCSYLMTSKVLLDDHLRID